MAITKETRTDLIELAVIANNASPGTTLLAELIAHVEAGKSLIEIGDALAARSAFKATYPAIQTADEFAKEYVGNLLPEASAELAAECETIVAAHVNAGKGFGELFVAIHGVLDTDTSAALATHVANYKNKATVAEYHTVTLETAAESSSVLASVTSSVLSVTTGKAAADGSASSTTASGPTYALSANAASVNEGDTGVFTLDTTGVASGSDLSYTVTGVNGSDITGSTVGTTKIGADGKGLIAVSTVADTTTEGAETLTVSVAGQSASMTVNDTSLTAPPAAETIALTTGIDNKTTGAGDDSFSGTNATLTTGDILNGGEGSDTLSVTTSITAATAVNGFTTTSIENANINLIDGNTGANHVLTVNMVDASIGTVTVSGTSTAGQADGVTLSNVDSGTSVAMSGTTNMDLTVNYDATFLAGTGDGATLTLSGNTHGGAANNDITYGAGIETLTINSIGSANLLGDIVWGGSALNVTGSQNLTIADTLAATAQDISAADFSGRLSVVLPNTDDKTNSSAVDITDVTVTGGSGNDTIDVRLLDAAIEMDIKGGAGDDTVIFGVANLAVGSATLAADSIDGGDGTDSIQTTTSLANSATAAANSTVKNMEILRVQDSNTNSITLANIQSGLNQINLVLGSAGGTTVFPAGTSNVATITAANGGAYTAIDTGTGTSDALTVQTISTATVDMGNNNAFNFTGLETVTMDTTTLAAAGADAMELDVSTITMAADTGGTTTLNVTGTGTFHSTGALTANVINFSGMSTANHGVAAGDSVNMAVAAAAGLTTMTGSAGRDTLIGDAASTISGGAGADSITGGSGNDTLNGDAGNDTIVLNAGNDTVDGGDGNDTITTGGNLTTADKIAGGAGTDTLSVTNADLVAIQGQTISEANTFNTTFTGMERLLVANGLDSTGDSFDLGYLSGVNHVTVGTLANQAQTIAGFNSGGTLNLTTTMSLDITATVNSAVTGASDALTIGLTGNADDDYDAATVANVETLTIDVTQSTADAVNSRTATFGLTTSQTTAAAGGSGAAQTINVIGTEDLVIDTTVTVATLNASGMSARTATTPGLVMSNATGHTAAQTITGSGGADTIIGSTKGDTIDLGLGNDTVTPGLGADTVTGGTGTDTLIYTTAVTATNIEGSGTGQATGIVVNLGATSLTNANVLGTTTQSVSGGLTAVASGQVAYLFSGSAPTNSTVVDTVTGIENVTLADGINYVVGTAGANIVLGGSGADSINPGNGADTIRGGDGADAITITETAANAAVDTIQYTATSDGSAADSTSGDNAGAVTGADTITGFNVATDVIAITGSVFGATGADATAITFANHVGAAGGANNTGIADPNDNTKLGIYVHSTDFTDHSKLEVYLDGTISTLQTNAKNDTAIVIAGVDTVDAAVGSEVALIVYDPDVGTAGDHFVLGTLGALDLTTLAAANFAII